MRRGLERLAEDRIVQYEREGQGLWDDVQKEAYAVGNETMGDATNVKPRPMVKSRGVIR